MAKFLPKIISLLVGQSEYFIKNSTDFVHKIREIKIDEGDKMVSFDIVIPIDEAIGIIIIQRLQKDETNMTPDRICNLVKLCITSTSFEFENN